MREGTAEEYAEDPGPILSYEPSDLLPDEFYARDKVLKLLPSSPAGSLAEATVGGEREAVRRCILKAGADAIGNIFGRLNVIALHVDDSDGDVLAFGNRLKQFQLGKFAAGHFEMDFVDMHLQKGGKHRRIAARANPSTLVISEAKMGREPAFAGN